MVIGAAPERPMKLALGLVDRNIVDAGFAPTHQTMLVELPLFVPMRAPPLPLRIVRFIYESHGNSVSSEGPHFFDQSIVEFAFPLASQESLDGLAA